MEFKIEKKGYAPTEVDAFVASLRKEYESTLAQQKERIFELKNQLSAVEKDLNAAREKSGLVSKAILSAVAKAEEIERLSQMKYNQEILQLKAFHDKWTDYYYKILERYPLDDQLAAAGRFNAQMAKILSRVDDSATDLKTLFPVSAAERTYKSESDRLSETQIGYIKVKADSVPGDDEAILGDMGVDPSSPIMTGDFDPIERISRYLNGDISRAAKSEPTPEAPKEETPETPAAPKAAVADSAATNADYADRTPLGYSFEEAMNPKEDLADIMRDLGLLMEE